MKNKEVVSSSCARDNPDNYLLKCSALKCSVVQCSAVHTAAKINVLRWFCVMQCNEELQKERSKETSAA